MRTMLSEEYNAKLARVRELFRERAYGDMTRIVHVMDWKECNNLDLLWMLALESYVPGKGALNTLTEAQIHALLSRAKVDNKPAGTAYTPPAPVVVFQSQLWYGPADPYPDLVGSSIEPAYQLTVQRPVGGFLSFTTAGIPIDQYLLIKYPSTESVKTRWTHDLFNNGDLPDSVFREVHTAGGFRYIASRIPITLNPLQSINFS